MAGTLVSKDQQEVEMSHSQNRPGMPDIRGRGAADIPSDAALKNRADPNEAEPDDIIARRAATEALRHAGEGETFIVPADLEDDGERAAAPGTREQE